jgi:uncharacterized protein YeaO (DUF488 family)
MPTITKDERIQAMLKIKRAYKAAARSDGKRFLVERLWPRGIKKSDLQIDSWLKDVAPSTELRRWFSHDPARWQKFRRRYFAELGRNPQSWQPIIEAARQQTVTLIYSAHDSEHNNAVALRDYLANRLRIDFISEAA